MGKHCSNTTLNYIVTHSLQTEFEEQNFIKECHAVPREIQIIIVEM
jgi:hypothetical protein